MAGHVERGDGRFAIERALDALDGILVTLNYKDKNKESVSGILSHDRGGNAYISVGDGQPRLVDPKEIESVDF